MLHFWQTKLISIQFIITFRIESYRYFCQYFLLYNNQFEKNEYFVIHFKIYLIFILYYYK